MGKWVRRSAAVVPAKPHNGCEAKFKIKIWLQWQADLKRARYPIVRKITAPSCGHTGPASFGLSRWRAKKSARRARFTRLRRRQAFSISCATRRLTKLTLSLFHSAFFSFASEPKDLNGSQELEERAGSRSPKCKRRVESGRSDPKAPRPCSSAAFGFRKCPL